ncbi:hypothetical protein HDV00_003194 [Rhizophlyctis rosea]|nr:hypothetical protein HDV00_003194 [Rhizophlyctis rosea]
MSVAGSHAAKTVQHQVRNPILLVDGAVVDLNNLPDVITPAMAHATRAQIITLEQQLLSHESAPASTSATPSSSRKRPALTEGTPTQPPAKRAANTPDQKITKATLTSIFNRLKKAAKDAKTK